MADEEDKVVHLNIRPATHKFHHHGYTVVVTYNRDTKRWDWVATKSTVVQVELEGKASTSGRALAEAKKRIDRDG